MLDCHLKYGDFICMVSINTYDYIYDDLNLVPNNFIYVCRANVPEKILNKILEESIKVTVVNETRDLLPGS